MTSHQLITSQASTSSGSLCSGSTELKKAMSQERWPDTRLCCLMISQEIIMLAVLNYIPYLFKNAAIEANFSNLSLSARRVLHLHNSGGGGGGCAFSSQLRVLHRLTGVSASSLPDSLG